MEQYKSSSHMVLISAMCWLNKRQYFHHLEKKKSSSAIAMAKTIFVIKLDSALIRRWYDCLWAWSIRFCCRKWRTMCYFTGYLVDIIYSYITHYNQQSFINFFPASKLQEKLLNRWISTIDRWFHMKKMGLFIHLNWLKI